MSKDWQFVLNETSVHFLLGLRAKQRRILLNALESLANDPMHEGHFVAKDATGRPIQIKVVGKYMISYWPDSFVKELRIINFEEV